MKKEAKNLAEIHSAVLLFGIAGLFGKLLTLPPLIIVLGRVSFALLALAILFAITRRRLALTAKQDYLFLLGLGIILAAHWGAFFYSIQLSSVAVGLLTFSTFPVFVAFIEPLASREKITKGNIVPALITLTGVALIVNRPSLSESVTRGALWGIASGFTFALLSIANKKLVRRYPALVITFYEGAAAALVLSPFLVLLKPSFTTTDIALLAFLGLVCTALAHTLFIEGMTHIKAYTASIIACLEPVYGIIAAMLLLGEIPALRTIGGGVLIIGAALYATVRSLPERI